MQKRNWYLLLNGKHYANHWDKTRTEMRKITERLNKEEQRAGRTNVFDFEEFKLDK
jgi:hypothetical protein